MSFSFGWHGPCRVFSSLSGSVLNDLLGWFLWGECEARCYNHCKGGYTIRILLCSKIPGDQSAKISPIVRHLPISYIFLIVFNTEGNKNRRRSMWSLGLSGGVECWTGDLGSSKAGGQSYQFRVDEHHTPPTIQPLELQNFTCHKVKF